MSLFQVTQEDGTYVLVESNKVVVVIQRGLSSSRSKSIIMLVGDVAIHAVESISAIANLYQLAQVGQKQ